MCVRVAVDGNGAHLSIFIHMMRGPFDNHLKWPFRCYITIHLVNQAEDNDHVENIVPYNDTTPDSCAGRVTSSDKVTVNCFSSMSQSYIMFTSLSLFP